MMSHKTASLVVLLNIFSLNSAFADALYDSLKSQGKFDTQTTSTARQNTVEADQRNKVNAQTDNNPNFVPLSSLPSKTYTPAELKKMRDEEANEPETDDSKADEETEAKMKKEGKDKVVLGTKAPESGPIIPAAPTKGHGPTVDLVQPKNAGIKVKNEDPDEVSFPSEDDSGPKSPTNKR